MSMSYRLHRCWFTKVPGNPRQTVLHLKANQKRCSWFPERSLATLRQKIPGHGWRTITCELSAGHQLAYRDTDENVTDVSSSSSQAGMTSLALALQRNASQDGVGHAAAIVYATSVNTRFDGDAKRFRFQSTVAITLADFISVTMPFFPHLFLFLGSVSSATSSAALIAQTACRPRIQASWALRGNLADCTRAGQTQGRLMGLIGTVAGAGVSWVIGPNPWQVISCLVPLAACSLYSMYISSGMVVLRSFNLQRAERVYLHLLTSLMVQLDGRSLDQLRVDDVVIVASSPEEIAKEEVFVSDYKSVFDRPMVLQPILGGRPALFRGAMRAACVDLETVLPLLTAKASETAKMSTEATAWTTSWHSSQLYAIAHHRQYGLDTNASPFVLLWYSVHATDIEKLQAMWHACALRFFSVAGTRHPAPTVETVNEFSHKLWPAVSEALSTAKWSTSATYLDGEGGFLYPEENPG